ncbi:MAG: PD-(D/E)XK nuclease family protein [Paludibacteraceae bacterium]|nr:PD-(D/E)XK nuclease family protein [Paludibacteraceae bacterium]
MENSFIRQTAQSIIDQMDWKQLGRTTFVLPSHRAGLVLKDELLRLQHKQNAQAVWAPRVQTLTQLQDSLSPLYPEDELFTVLRLYHIFRSLGDDTSLTLDQFYRWGRQMLADFTNVDASMHAEEVPDFFDNAIAAHELGQWQLDPEVEERLRALIGMDTTRNGEKDSLRAQYEILWRKIYTIYCALHDQMVAEQKGYPGMRQRAVIEQWESEYIQSQIEGRTFIFVGFNYMLPVERELMALLREAGQAQFYWDYVPNFRTNEKAFSFTQLNSSILGSQNPENSIQTEWPKPVMVISCVSKEAQAQYVHRWLQENYTEKGQKVGVVICDETMLEPVIYTLPAITLPGQSEPEPVNITKGFPLRNTAIYAQVMKWLYDPRHGQAEDLISPDFIDHLLTSLIPEKPEETKPIEKPEEPLSWQELLILESEYQTRKILNQLRQIVAQGLDDIPFTLQLLRLLIRRMMESVTLPFHGEPVTDIQVMGVLETRLLDFDKLLILNVDEGILPQRQADTSFIPFYLRKAYHMQTSDERATVYAYNFFRLLSRSGHTTLLHGQPDTIGGSRGMSRFIMQILYSDEFDVSRQELQEACVVVEPGNNPFTPIGTFASTHPNRLSPSALNTYITCPRAFYHQYVEKMRPEKEEGVRFSPSTLGSFVHHAMEYLYTHYLHCDNTKAVQVLPDEIEAIRTSETAIQEALTDAYKKMNELWQERHPDEFDHYLADLHAPDNVLIKGFVNNVLERDREDAKVGLQIYQLEKDYLFPVTIEGYGEIYLGGTIDRLDLYGPKDHETLRIVDYKSGGYNDKTHEEKMSATWDEIMSSPAKDYVRQTMTYCHAVMVRDKSKRPIEPHLYFCRHRMTDITTTIDVNSVPVTNYRDIKDDFLQALQNKVAEVLNTTDFPQCEEGKCPNYCPFFSLCRRTPNEF